MAADLRIALLVESDLYIIRIELGTGSDDTTTMGVERVDLRSEPVRLSLTEEIQKKDAPSEVTHTWRVEFEEDTEPLEFVAHQRHNLEQTSDDPTLAFGWRLAKLIGWSIPGDEGPMVEVI